MFGKWGALVARRRALVLVLVIVASLASGVWGVGVFDKLTQGGYVAEDAESQRANRLVTEQFGQQNGDIAIVYSAPDVTNSSTSNKITKALDALPRTDVREVTSFYGSKSPALIDKTKTHTLVSITLPGEESGTKAKHYDAIADKLTVDGVQTQIGGTIPTQQAMNDRSNKDLTVAEAISVPITLLLLVLIFGSVVSAALPVLVGGLSIFASLGVLRLISFGVDINIFAVNVASLLGLGLAIDYGLFTVGRFREEREKGASTKDAVITTVSTAGRTVAFSATLLVLALAGMLVIPLDFLRSMAYGGMAAVAIAALVSLTLLPALLALLGTRVDAIALPWRRGKPVRDPGWLRRLATVVMRRPLVFAAPIVIVLVFLALPIGSMNFGTATEKQLPPGDPYRAAAASIAEHFPASGNGAAQIVVQGKDNQSPEFVAKVGNVAGVTGVTPTAHRGDITVLTVTLSGDPQGDQAKDTVRALRALAAPAGTTVLVGGFTAGVVDGVAAVTDNLPLMILILVGATLILMFAAFRSVVLPIKAVLMSALSLSATFGVLVWIFQLGHGAQWLNVTAEPTQPGMIVLIGAVVFGLSTDYETFLLSRMVEARRDGADTTTAVRTGLVRTGRMISSAALLLIVVTGAFALSSLSVMRFIGVGMIVALVLDATVVRMMLVPAVLRLLGRAAWWPLRPRSDVDSPDPRELEHV